MYRSASATRFSDEFTANVIPASKTLPLIGSQESDTLPLYRAYSDGSKKQSGVQRRLTMPAEYVVHLIPVILIVSVFILWFNSHHTENI